MTRINCVHPRFLQQKHLIAEYRELPRIFGLVRKAIERGEVADTFTPLQYTLGKGHVKFFYPRLGWLKNRQQSLIDECLRRGFNIKHTDVDSLTDNIPHTWLGDWKPRPKDIVINIQRIDERGGLKFKYDGRDRA